MPLHTTMRWYLPPLVCRMTFDKTHSCSTSWWTVFWWPVWHLTTLHWFMCINPAAAPVLLLQCTPASFKMCWLIYQRVTDSNIPVSQREDGGEDSPSVQLPSSLLALYSFNFFLHLPPLLWEMPVSWGGSEQLRYRTLSSSSWAFSHSSEYSTVLNLYWHVRDKPASTRLENHWAQYSSALWGWKLKQLPFSFSRFAGF